MDELTLELITGANQAHIATLLPDGAPHSVPVWAGWEGDLLVFITGPGSRKARNVARDPGSRCRSPTARTPAGWLPSAVASSVSCPAKAAGPSSTGWP